MKDVIVRKATEGDDDSEIIYNVFYKGENTGFIAKKIIKDGPTRYYPFKIKDGEIVPKYDKIKCITLKDRKYPKPGFSKNEKSGYGFTNANGLSHFVKFWEKQYPIINEIIFIKEGKSGIEGQKFNLLISDFHELLKKSKRNLESQKRERELLFKSTLAKISPESFETPSKKKYHPGDMSKYIQSFGEIVLSESDKSEIKDLLIHSGLSLETVISTRKALDIIYYEDVIEEYKSLLEIKTKSGKLEEKWHQFFKKYSWIFTQIFSFPAVKLGDKFNVGGSSIEGDTDRIADFIYKNVRTSNIAIIEIKTHLSDLVNKSPYRNPNIYSVSSELSGSIVQVLDQKNQLSRNFHAKIASKANNLNSICIVIAGRTSSLVNKGQKESFELYRWSNKDVLIVPFDELLNKIENVLELFKSESKE